MIMATKPLRAGNQGSRSMCKSNLLTNHKTRPAATTCMINTRKYSVMQRENHFVKTYHSRSRNLRLDTINMGNPNTNGIFAPLVRVTRNVLGTKRFNKIRGKGIQLHSQVITEFCKTIGAPPKTRQQLIKTAKDNGGKLGFLA